MLGAQYVVILFKAAVLVGGGGRWDLCGAQAVGITMGPVLACAIGDTRLSLGILAGVPFAVPGRSLVADHSQRPISGLNRRFGLARAVLLVPALTLLLMVISLTTPGPTSPQSSGSAIATAVSAVDVY